MTAIDVTDFSEALEADQDGTFHQAVETHLQQVLADHQALLQRGLEPEAFTAAKQIEAAYTTAVDVIRFSRSINQNK
jgi:hypothetical protein